jgi:hypothetical protein
MARELSVSQKGALSAVVLHPGGGKIVNRLGRNARLYKRGDFVQNSRCYRAGRPHRIQIPFALQNDHRLLANLATMKHSRNPGLFDPGSDPKLTEPSGRIIPSEAAF